MQPLSAQPDIGAAASVADEYYVAAHTPAVCVPHCGVAAKQRGCFSNVRPVSRQHCSAATCRQQKIQVRHALPVLLAKILMHVMLTTFWCVSSALQPAARCLRARASACTSAPAGSSARWVIFAVHFALHFAFCIALHCIASCICAHGR